MLSVKAIYDGNTLQLLEPVEIKTAQEVIVTFLHDVPGAVVPLPVDEIQGLSIQQLIHNSAALDFLKADEEDVYTDEDLKVKY
jgi:hypothetical protein